MAQDFNIASDERGTGCFKEAVCIDAMRICVQRRRLFMW